jgi:hypothetical protein
MKTKKIVLRGVTVLKSLTTLFSVQKVLLDEFVIDG